MKRFKQGGKPIKLKNDQIENFIEYAEKKLDGQTPQLLYRYIRQDSTNTHFEYTKWGGEYQVDMYLDSKPIVAITLDSNEKINEYFQTPDGNKIPLF